MPRTALPIEEAPSASPLTTNALTWTAADVANGNYFVWTGREVLLVRNVGVGSRNITFQSVASLGRQDPLHNSAIAIGAGVYQAYGPFTNKGWRQTDGNVYVSGDNAEVEFIVLRQPTS